MIGARSASAAPSMLNARTAKIVIKPLPTRATRQKIERSLPKKQRGFGCLPAWLRRRRRRDG